MSTGDYPVSLAQEIAFRVPVRVIVLVRSAPFQTNFAGICGGTGASRREPSRRYWGEPPRRLKNKGVNTRPLDRLIMWRVDVRPALAGEVAGGPLARLS